MYVTFTINFEIIYKSIPMEWGDGKERTEHIVWIHIEFQIYRVQSIRVLLIINEQRERLVR